MSVNFGFRLESCLSYNVNQFFAVGGDWHGLLDDGIFKCGQYVGKLGERIAYLRGNQGAEEKSRSLSNAFGAGRDALGGFRFLIPLYKLFTGQFFWQTDQNDEGQWCWRRVHCNAAGEFVTISDDELGASWHPQQRGGKWEWYNAETQQRSLDGLYIEDREGSCILRKWVSIVVDIIVCVARILSPIKWLHNLKVLDLGKHAKWMGGVVSAAWGIVLSLSLLQSIDNLLEPRNLKGSVQKFWEVFQAFIDLAALPFDFGAGAGHPVVSIIGAVLNLISAISLIAKEMVYYG